MTVMKDTEGEPIPNDSDRPMFDLTLHCGMKDGDTPVLLLNIPCWFEWGDSIYDSAGVIEASLHDVLNEYLEDPNNAEDAFTLATWLRDYADRLEKARADYLKQWEDHEKN